MASHVCYHFQKRLPYVFPRIHSRPRMSSSFLCARPQSLFLTPMTLHLPSRFPLHSSHYSCAYPIARALPVETEKKTNASLDTLRRSSPYFLNISVLMGARSHRTNARASGHRSLPYAHRSSMATNNPSGTHHPFTSISPWALTSVPCRLLHIHRPLWALIHPCDRRRNTVRRLP